jgi:hypothetical protein
MREICSYGSVGGGGGNEPLYPDNPARHRTIERETPSKAVWFGMGYIIYIPEIIRNSSIGANPICSKSVDRAVASHMGESERIAEPNGVSS